MLSYRIYSGKTEGKMTPVRYFLIDFFLEIFYKMNSTSPSSFEKLFKHSCKLNSTRVIKKLWYLNQPHGFFPSFTVKFSYSLWYFQNSSHREDWWQLQKCLTNANKKIGFIVSSNVPIIS